MTTTKHEPAHNGRMNCVLLPSVCEWFLAVWYSVSPEIVKKSFKANRISNEMDSSEDFMVSVNDKAIGCDDIGDDSSISSDSNDTSTLVNC
jgi:hypothetical protein